MKKKDVLVSGKTNASSKMAGAFRCGDCLHFKNHSHASLDGLCSKQGIRSFAIAPSCFTPNVTEITTNSDQFVQLISLFNEFTPKQRRVLSALMKTKKRKYEFGTKVYFKAVGKDYLSNYLSGFVVGYSSSGEVMVQGDPDKYKRGNAFVALFRQDTELYTTKEFKAKRRELIDKGRVSDPDKPLVKRKKVQIDYEPPTMDTVPDNWYTKEKEVKVKKPKTNKGASIAEITIV